ncbi:MAG TPA: PQQ-dependent sugar dehydrogenase, partial [Anaerolineales bacterium]
LSLAASGLSSPVFITNAGDSSGRLFIVEQAGRIRIVQNGALQAAPFLDITGRVRSPASGGGSEQGLLSAAFPPGYGTGKDYFYVYYTRLDGNNQVSRFHLNTSFNAADPHSEEPILLLNHPTYENHNGGQLNFGPDGYLYIGTGDGGGAGDPSGNAQNPASLLGKLLRIDVEPHPNPGKGSFHLFFPLSLKNSDGTPSRRAYSIPADNPYAQTAGYRGEVWALGLRNPWRFSFDRLAGDLYIADVGQDRVEEVNFQTASSRGGENYGWNILEGDLCYNPSSGCTPPPRYAPPVFTYEHGLNDANGCSITGGYVYRGPAYPALQGIYFYGDYCTGRIWGLSRDGGAWQNHEFSIPHYQLTSFGEDQAGELYVAATNGSIYQIQTP